MRPTFADTAPSVNVSMSSGMTWKSESIETTGSRNHKYSLNPAKRGHSGATLQES